MNNIFLGAAIVFFLILNSIVQSQNECEWSENYDSIECGFRQSGDQLLFNDILSSNWTVEINNRLEVEYVNINITWWRVELSSNWYILSQSVYYPYFWISAGVSNSTQGFIMNVTVYGYPTDNIEVPFGCILQQYEKHGNNTINPKYQEAIKN